MLGSKIMSLVWFFFQRISRFCSPVLTPIVSHSFNRMVSKVVLKGRRPVSSDESAYLPSFDADDARRI